MQCKIKAIKYIYDLFPECRPEVGKVYDADYIPGSGKAGNIAVIDLAGKRIALRKGEFEIMEE